MSTYPPTPHNSAAAGEIAENVILCGDPHRARYIAETYLSDAFCYTQTRGILGYTGTYQGQRVSVQSHGMGIPSLAIYVSELYEFYGVKRIIRVGSAGSIDRNLRAGEVLAAISACSTSPLSQIYGLPGSYSPTASYPLLEQSVAALKAAGASPKVGIVLSDDIFYRSDDTAAAWNRVGVQAVEMETAGLYLLSAAAHREAVSLLTITAELFEGGTEADDYSLQSLYDTAIRGALNAVTVR